MENIYTFMCQSLRILGVHPMLEGVVQGKCNAMSVQVGEDITHGGSNYDSWRSRDGVMP